MTPGDASNLAKEALRLVTTAGLSKDVIDLLEKKLSLIGDELAQVTARSQKFERENAELKEHLQTLLSRHDSLDDTTEKVLRLFFESSRDLSVPAVARATGQKEGVAHYHVDVLCERGFVRRIRPEIIVHDSVTPAAFGLTKEGRAFIVQKGA
jgi:hypothetical protein